MRFIGRPCFRQGVSCAGIGNNADGCNHTSPTIAVKCKNIKELGIYDEKQPGTGQQ